MVAQDLVTKKICNAAGKRAFGGETRRRVCPKEGLFYQLSLWDCSITVTLEKTPL